MLFGITFILFILKISAPKGIWYNLRTADPDAHKYAITYQRHNRKINKAELDLEFLLNCRNTEVYPTNVKWKILRKFKGKERKRYYERNLQKMISDERKQINLLRKEGIKINDDFKNSLTWMKYTVFKISINRLIQKEKDMIIKRHQAKLDKLIISKASREGLQKNPNDIILNLSGETLSQEEINVLNLGLKYGIALRPKEEDIIPITEAFYSKLMDMKIIKENHMSGERIKNALRSFAYNTLEIENKRYFTDSKILKTIRNLKERMIIVKPDKGQGVVLLRKSDYIESLENIFNDETKFKEVYVDHHENWYHKILPKYHV